MAKTCVFLSSTCYDLKALREHLREKVEEWGHDLLASEYPSFPVSPDLSTVENCKKVVRDHADIFVLIVGGKRGSLAPGDTRSVVNVEYAEAKTRGIPCFVFVDKQVSDLLPVYQKNPDADFSPAVDFPEVFKLLADLKADSRWIYTFSRTEDISETLRTQLSILLKTLVERGRAGTLVVPRDFASDSSKIISIIQERPRFWEYLLTCELLESSISAGQRRLDQLAGKLVYRPMLLVPEEGVLPHLCKLMEDLVNLISVLEPATVEVTRSWGPPGTPGDPLEIRRACAHIDSVIQGIADWETGIYFTKVPGKYEPLINSLQGSTAEVIQELRRAPKELREFLHAAASSTGMFRGEIQLTIKSPSTLVAANVELAKLRSTLQLS